MADGDIGPKIVLEGEKEYKKAISDINKEMRVLTSEMKATSAQFDGNANSIDALTKKGDILKREYDEQVKKVRTLQGALDDVKNKYGENSDQVKDWQIKLNNAQAELSTLDKELKTNDKYLDEAKNSTDGVAKSIDEYGKEIKEASDKTLSFGDVLKANLASQAIVEGVKGLGNAAANAAGKVVDLATGAASYADDMLTISTRTGIATDKLQAYNYMAELTDVSLDDMTKTMARNIRGMGEAQRGTKSYSEAYEKLKINIKDGNGNLRDSEEVYWDVIDALGNMTNETERDALAMQLFGKSAQDLNPLIEIGSKGVAKFTDEAKNMGAILDDEALTSLGKTDDALQRLTQATEIAKREFGSAMAPAMTEAAEKITKKVTDMDDKFAKFAGGALNLTVDGLGWVMDNAGIIAGGIGGIATGMAVFKAGSAIQAGMDLAVKAWQKYKTATEGATIAQYALNVAQNLSPIGIIATAVGALTAGLIIYKATAGDAKDETDLLNDKLQETISASEEFNKKAQETIDGRKKHAEEIENEYGALKILADELFDLAEKENKTNSEKAKMVALVEQLNKGMPDLNLSIDEQNGLLNKQREEVDKLITSNLELAKVEAAKEDLTRIAKEQYEAEKTLAQNQKDRSKALEELNKLEAEYNGLVSDGVARSASATQQEKNRTLQAIELDGKIYKLKETIGELDGQIDDTNETIRQYGVEWDETSSYIGDHSDIDATSKAVDEFGNTVDATSDTIVNANKEAMTSINELTKTYEEAVNNRTKDILGAMGLFDEFALDTEISGKKLMDNLQSQIEGMKDWAENLQELAEKGIDEGLLKELEEMGPQAASEIAALNQLSEPELKKYSDMWKEKSKLARQQAIREMDTLKTETETKIKELTKTVEKDLYTSGQNAAEGFAQGFESKRYRVYKMIDGVLQGVVTQGNKILEINSPSKVFAKMGAFSAEGYEVGFKNKMLNVNSEIADSLLTDMNIDSDTNMAGNIDNNIYNAFAAVASDILIPALQNIGIELTANEKNGGLLNYIKIEANRYKNRTGNDLLLE
jgi:chromosome segregation ATPase